MIEKLISLDEWRSIWTTDQVEFGRIEETRERLECYCDVLVETGNFDKAFLVPAMTMLSMIDYFLEEKARKIQ